MIYNRRAYDVSWMENVPLDAGRRSPWSEVYSQCVEAIKLIDRIGGKAIRGRWSPAYLISGVISYCQIHQGSHNPVIRDIDLPRAAREATTPGFLRYVCGITGSY